MGWREQIIEHYTKDIAELEEGIALMESGVMEVRSKTLNGPWVVENASIIERDKSTIAMLRGIIAKAERGET